MTTTKQTDWRSIVVKADPDWNRDRRYVNEYEFTSRGTASDSAGEKTHEGQRRVFRGYYDRRGPYAD